MTDIATGSEELLDLDAWDKLEPIETKRMELVDGIVIVAPRPALQHANVLARLIVLFAKAEVLAYPEPEVVIDDRRPATVRVPDIVLARPDVSLSDPGRFQLGEVLLAVEIVSPGSRRTDYIAKRYDYEQAGIGCYWIVDPDKRTITCLKLVDGHYLQTQVATGETMITSEPLKINLSWTELLS